MLLYPVTLSDPELF